ncbi:hypothetical protein WN944_023448 [Citrus x changshan-huyou]|uniref:Uncharacterized protein n=1 Tax=Citrus x changshan-huyou TaxID=2935761 RepID=A0AAP0N0D7_9ROSI
MFVIFPTMLITVEAAVVREGVYVACEEGLFPLSLSPIPKMQCDSMRYSKGDLLGN